MSDKMTSKRNSRVFLDEAAHHGETNHQQKPHATATTYRSRRNSRSSAERGETALGQEPEDEKKTLNTMASRDSLSAAVAASNNKETVTINMAHAKGKARVPPTASQSHSANSILADAPKPASSASSDTESMSSASTEGLPHNFGVVIPGVYRSSYPKPEHFRFMKELKLRTMV